MEHGRQINGKYSIIASTMSTAKSIVCESMESINDKEMEVCLSGESIPVFTK